MSASPDVPAASPGRRWFLADVLAPFLLTRAALLVVAYYAASMPACGYWPVEPLARGWHFVPSWPLDAWGRFDTYWYLDVAANGYVKPPGAVGAVNSSLAFFPLYPLLARGLHALLPAGWQGPAALYLGAVALANGFALAGLALVRTLVAEVLGDAAAARRTVLLLLLFPTGFFLSCAYTESLFLALTAAAMLLAHRGRFWAAGAVGILAAATRANGVLLAVPMGCLWLQARGLHPRRWRWDALALLLPLLGLAAHAAWLGRVTADPLAVFHAQASWGRFFAWPWRTLSRGGGYLPQMVAIDRATVLLLLGLAVAAFRVRFAWGVFAACALAPILFSGVLVSASRFAAVVFPAFAVLALGLRGERWLPLAGGAMAALQGALFAAWVRYCWVA